MSMPYLSQFAGSVAPGVLLSMGYSGNPAVMLGLSQPRRGGRKSRGPPRVRKFTDPYAVNEEKVTCAAETYQTYPDGITGIPGQTWISCRGKVAEGDVVCSIHRREVNAAAATLGHPIGNVSNVRVPSSAFNHVDAAFANSFLPALWTELVKKLGSGTVIANAGDKTAMFEIWNPGLYAATGDNSNADKPQSIIANLLENHVKRETPGTSTVNPGQAFEEANKLVLRLEQSIGAGTGYGWCSYDVGARTLGPGRGESYVRQCKLKPLLNSDPPLCRQHYDMVAREKIQDLASVGMKAGNKAITSGSRRDLIDVKMLRLSVPTIVKLYKEGKLVAACGKDFQGTMTYDLGIAACVALGLTS
jgi:hypothetical protein